MAIKIGDRFYPTNGWTKLEAAADLEILLEIDERREASFVDLTSSEWLVVFEQVAARMSDEAIVTWLDAKATNEQNMLAGDIYSDQYFDMDVAIDERLLESCGFGLDNRGGEPPEVEE